MSVTARQSAAMFLPAWNEGLNLPDVVEEAVSCLGARGHPFKVIIVDDGSTDNTVEVFGQLERIYGEVVALVRHERNLGYGAALRTGLREALGTGHEWIGFCDADGQFSPHDICKMINEAVTRQVDLVIGCRVKRADSLLRRLMGRGWHLLSRIVLGYEAKDVDCGFKVFRRDALLVLEPRLLGDHATISPEILTWAKRLGHRVVEFDVQHRPRANGEQSGANLTVIFSSVIGLFRLRRTLNRKAA